MDVSAIPLATVLIMLVAVAISFINMGLNRLLITRMIGWREYHAMQKEIAEHNAQRMAAMRANDTKALERLKKKESQIMAMQTKMFKPQMVLIPITFIYLIIWPVLMGYFPQPVAYVPGFGLQPFFLWYLICSFFFGTIASRVVGVTPIQ
ncbi:MAG: EMC3/TMCO1 family protein [Candidatus Bathyarchaeia archaeon]